MSSIPSITEWIETALTTVAVRPDLRESLHEELEQWVTTAVGVQVSGRFRYCERRAELSR
jgi:hypothetical protein